MTKLVIVDADRDGGASLNESAYQRIREDIISCQLLPGHSYTEGQLAERYDLGKAPIRYGLARLCHEGLVRSQARRGYVISPFTIQDAQEIFQMRLLLEPKAAHFAAGRISEETLPRLHAAALVSYDPGDRASEAAFLNANKAFHVGVAEASGNQRLAVAIGHLLDEHRRLLHMGLTLRARGEDFQNEHVDLLKVLLAGDGEKAEALVREQIQGGQEMVIEGLLTHSNTLVESID
jgi:DNA-binding GntR family transcriptional regulator